MVTADEIGSIAVFAGLSEADRERLARAAADITLRQASTRRTRAASARSSPSSTGGSRRSSSSTGSSASSASAQPGDIFGEVPIALGTVFPVGFRAAEASRVLRIEPHDYHARRGRASPTSRRRSAGSRPTG